MFVPAGANLSHLNQVNVQLTAVQGPEIPYRFVNAQTENMVICFISMLKKNQNNKKR